MNGIDYVHSENGICFKRTGSPSIPSIPIPEYSQKNAPLVWVAFCFHDSNNICSRLTSAMSLHAQVQFHAKYPLFDSQTDHAFIFYDFSYAILSKIRCKITKLVQSRRCQDFGLNLLWMFMVLSCFCPLLKMQIKCLPIFSHLNHFLVNYLYVYMSALMC